MYDSKDIQFVGKHDYDEQQSIRYAQTDHFKTFSIGIFKWELKNNGKSMKRGKCVVRVKANAKDQKKAFDIAESIVQELDKGEYCGGKTISIA